MASAMRWFLLLCLLAQPLCAAAQESSSFETRRWTAEAIAAGQTQQRPELPPRSDARGCAGATIDQLGSDAGYYGQGLKALPRNMAKRSNLKWEIPIAIATVVLIEGVDTHVSRQFDVGSDAATAADNASNALLGAEFGAAALTYAAGCEGGHSHARRAGFAAMEAAGYGISADLLLKAVFNREYPSNARGDARFWHGGKSFPSGHAATSWAIASAMAHQYPQKRWVKWTAYGAATGISVLRLAALKHFPSDIVVGGTLGYVTGSYIGGR
jgi:hypothetical protein